MTCKSILYNQNDTWHEPKSKNSFPVLHNWFNPLWMNEGHIDTILQCKSKQSVAELDRKLIKPFSSP